MASWVTEDVAELLKIATRYGEHFQLSQCSV